jgi:antitoxin (DNA-binding transcriptional repressor) of toxin-antitoxin stability system
MDHLQFTKLSSSAKEYFDQVEKGKSYLIIREGKPIAKVIPFKEPIRSEKAIRGWQREVKTVTLRSGADSSKYIREERDER